jgi:hypothetical protein
MPVFHTFVVACSDDLFQVFNEVFYGISVGNAFAFKIMCSLLVNCVNVVWFGGLVYWYAIIMSRCEPILVDSLNPDHLPKVDVSWILDVILPMNLL